VFFYFFYARFYTRIQTKQLTIIISYRVISPRKIKTRFSSMIKITEYTTKRVKRDYIQSYTYTEDQKIMIDWSTLSLSHRRLFVLFFSFSVLAFRIQKKTQIVTIISRYLCICMSMLHTGIPFTNEKYS